MMFGGRVTSWNLRDKHMTQTLEALLTHLDRENRTESARIVVWAHNSHVGDARATEMSVDGQVTLGQLVRERFGDNARLIGFTTHSGTVTAASEWAGVAERKVCSDPRSTGASKSCSTILQAVVFFCIGHDHARGRRSPWLKSGWVAPSG